MKLKNITQIEEGLVKIVKDNNLDYPKLEELYLNNVKSFYYQEKTTLIIASNKAYNLIENLYGVALE